MSAAPASGWVTITARGEAGLRDRSSAPHRIPHRTSEQRVEAIAALQRLRFTGPPIAEVLGISLSTVSGILTQIRHSHLSATGSYLQGISAKEIPGQDVCPGQAIASLVSSRQPPRVLA